MKTISAEWQLCSLEEVYPDPHCSLLYLQFRGWESTTVHHVAATVLHGVKGKVKYFLHLVTSLIYAPCLASIDTWLRSSGLDDSPHPTWCLSPYIPSSVMRVTGNSPSLRQPAPQLVTSEQYKILITEQKHIFLLSPLALVQLLELSSIQNTNKHQLMQ